MASVDTFILFKSGKTLEITGFNHENHRTLREAMRTGGDFVLVDNFDGEGGQMTIKVSDIVFVKTTNRDKCNEAVSAKVAS